MTEPAAGTGVPHTGDGYLPREITRDAAALGFVVTTIESEVGSCVARHRPERTSARATVFLHGAAGAWTTWTPLLHAAQTAGVVVPDPVLLDLPGWGDARLTREPDRIVIGAIAEIVASTLRELGYTEWDVVGHSLGGFVGMHLAVTFPATVTSVATVSGTTFSVIHSVDYPFRRFGELPGFAMLWRLMQLLAPLGPIGTALVKGAGAVGLLRPIFAPLFRHGTLVPRSLISATARDLRPRAFAAAARVAHGYDAGRWRDIRCPVIAIKGDRDVFVTDADLVHLGRLLPASTRVIIEDCGHFAQIERPSAVLGALGWVGPS